MATATTNTGARARSNALPSHLATTPAAVAMSLRHGAVFIPSPAPREPEVAAMVIAGIRCFEIHTTPTGLLTRWHQRDGIWFPLAVNASMHAATAAIGRFLSLVEHLPPGYSAEADETEVSAAVAVLAGPASLPLAA
ncbi:MAG TPA: hypothetical protein VEX11_17755 [Acetobacteraceae bacterium]|nr:hypothetical protein [Acetobacteraceae bacterium]